MFKSVAFLFGVLLAGALGVVPNCKFGNNADKCWECNPGYGVVDNQTECAPCPAGCASCLDNSLMCTQCEIGHIRHTIQGECVPCVDPNCDFCGEHATLPSKQYCYDCANGWKTVLATGKCVLA